MYTYKIVPIEMTDKKLWIAEVFKVSNSEGSTKIFSGIFRATEEEAIITSARWLMDYAEMQLMGSEEKEPRY
jgi:hypothetical protein